MGRTLQQDPSTQPFICINLSNCFLPAPRMWSLGLMPACSLLSLQVTLLSVRQPLTWLGLPGLPRGQRSVSATPCPCFPSASMWDYPLCHGPLPRGATSLAERFSCALLNLWSQLELSGTSCVQHRAGLSPATPAAHILLLQYWNTPWTLQVQAEQPGSQQLLVYKKSKTLCRSKFLIHYLTQSMWD